MTKVLTGLRISASYTTSDCKPCFLSDGYRVSECRWITFSCLLLRVLLLGGSLWLVMGGKSEAQDAVTVEKIREGIATVHSQIGAANLEITYSWKADTVVPGPKRAFLGTERTGIRGARFEMTIKEGKKFFARSEADHLQPGGRFETLKSEGAWDGQVATSQVGNDGFITREPTGPFWEDRYFHHTFYAFKPDEVSSAHTDQDNLHWLPFAFEKGQYEVQGTEAVDGELCHVVALPGRDRLWIDVSHGFAVRKREFSWGPDKPLRGRWLNRHLKNVAPGMWLPMECLREDFAGPDEPELQNQIVLRISLTVSKLEVNKPVSDELFRVAFPAGTWVVDKEKGTRKRLLAPGADPFADAIAEAQQRYTRKSAGGPPTWLVVNLAILAGAALSWAVRRVARAKHRVPPSAGTALEPGVHPPR